MKINRLKVWMIIVMLCAATLAASAGYAATNSAKKPAKQAAKRLPKLLDLGSTKCIPCRMMIPVLDDLAKEYKGRLDVGFIDVWKDRNAVDAYKIKSIPTQIFFNAKGKEIFRHVGFFPKKDILKAFAEHGVKLGKPAAKKNQGKK